MAKVKNVEATWTLELPIKFRCRGGIDIGVQRVKYYTFADRGSNTRHSMEVCIKFGSPYEWATNSDLFIISTQIMLVGLVGWCTRQPWISIRVTQMNHHLPANFQDVSPSTMIGGWYCIQWEWKDYIGHSTQAMWSELQSNSKLPARKRQERWYNISPD